MKPSERLKQLWLLQDSVSNLLRKLRKADKEVLDLGVDEAKRLDDELVSFAEHVNILVAQTKE